MQILSKIGDFTIFSIKAFMYIFTPPFRVKLIVEHLMNIGIASIGIIALSNFAIGMIFSLQLTIELYKFNAAALIGNVLAQVLSREVSPVIATLMLIAKNGSAITAELGTMHITEQINALRTMSVNPIQYLVSPRLVACIIMFPVLSAMANIVGLLGGAVVAFGMLKVEYAFTVNYMFNRLEPADIITGFVKVLFMGIATCLICSYYGLNSKGGSSGVGKTTTNAVVLSSITILIIDFLMGKIFLFLNIIN